MCDKCYKMLRFLMKDYSEIPSVSKGKRDHNIHPVRLNCRPEGLRENRSKTVRAFKSTNL